MQTNQEEGDANSPYNHTVSLEKLVGPHNQNRKNSKNNYRRKNGRGKDWRKTEIDIIGLDDERELQKSG